ncbi:hypothetical protein [Halolamina salina]|uniref:Uncharacterized protein n=1 Tax=Halolamina salina TaxID=1220023 RepID=A0ABD6B9Q0_9EURY
MPEVEDAEVTEMTDDELEEAVKEAVDTDTETADEEVMGFAPRDS